jgi:hypothetical protein
VVVSCEASEPVSGIGSDSSTFLGGIGGGDECRMSGGDGRGRLGDDDESPSSLGDGRGFEAFKERGCCMRIVWRKQVS